MEADDAAQKGCGLDATYSATQTTHLQHCQSDERNSRLWKGQRMTTSREAAMKMAQELLPCDCYRAVYNLPGHLYPHTVACATKHHKKVAAALDALMERAEKAEAELKEANDAVAVHCEYIEDMGAERDKLRELVRQASIEWPDVPGAWLADAKKLGVGS